MRSTHNLTSNSHHISSVMSTTGYSYQIPTVVYPLAVGLFASSGVFFGNLGLTLAGPMPIIKDELGESTLSMRQKLTVWRLFFDKAGVSMRVGTPSRAQARVIQVIVMKLIYLD